MNCKKIQDLLITDYMDNEEILQEESKFETPQKTILPEKGVSTVNARAEEEEQHPEPGNSSAEKDTGKLLSDNELFKGVAEIKKAVIYNEIFNRKYI